METLIGLSFAGTKKSLHTIALTQKLATIIKRIYKYPIKGYFLNDGDLAIWDSL